MAARAYWKGHLRLSLVTLGVELYSAVSSAKRLSLHQIHRPSGKRIRYEKIAPGIGPVDNEDIVKGYELDDDQYVLVEPEELDAIKLQSKRTIELVQFVDHCDIDPRYFEKPYYVVPRDNDVDAEGFAVIREALRRSEKVGVGQMTARGRDYIVAIKPCGDGLLLETLRFADEIRESDKIFDDVPDIDINEEMLDLAEDLIERKTDAFTPEAFKSQYADALRELIEEKRKGGKITEASDEELGARHGNVVDLMDALKKSVGKTKKSSRGKSGSASKGSKKKGSPKKRAAG